MENWKLKRFLISLKENPTEASEYSERLKENRLLTISKFDVSIIKDTEEFIH